MVCRIAIGTQHLMSDQCSALLLVPLVHSPRCLVYFIGL